MRFKFFLLIFPVLLLTNNLFAKTIIDSIGVENHDGKKIILHKVEPKETYFGVGRRYNIKPNLIIQYNNNIVLQPGMTIKVPTDMPFAATAAPVKPVEQPVVTAKPENKGPAQQYKVSAGETLYAISKRFGTTVDDIKAQNNLRSDVLSPGEILTIGGNNGPKPAGKETVAETQPVTPAPVQQPKPQVQQPVAMATTTQPPVTQPAKPAPINMENTQQYKVSNGETLYTIAKRFNTSVDDIIALNKLSNNTISPGEILVVRSGMPPAPAPEPKPALPRPDTSMVAAADSALADKHLQANRYGLFEKDEKGPATWMDDPSFDPNKKLVLHRTAPIGTVIKITNPMTNRTTFAKVVGSFTDSEATKDVILVVTKNVADSLGAMDKRFRVNISYGVPNNDQ